MKYADLKKKGDLTIKLVSDDPESNIVVESMRFAKNLEQALAWTTDFTESIKMNHGGFDELKTSDLSGKFERFLFMIGFPVTIARGRKGEHTWRATLYK